MWLGTGFNFRPGLAQFAGGLMTTVRNFRGWKNLFIQIQIEGRALLADLAMNFEFLRLSASYVLYKETKSNDQTTPLGRHG
jgi:hypothetical protein